MRLKVIAMIAVAAVLALFYVRGVRLSAVAGRYGGPAVAFGGGGQADRAADHGSVIEHDADVSKQEPGTHNGGGETTGYSFFAKVKDSALVFRKRALHPGSAIGLHKQDVDEVYYILSGTGELTLDGEKHQVSAGTAILTRPGSSHSLKQTGNADLVMIIAYPPETKP